MTSIMQNKPNLLYAQMNVSNVKTMIYQNFIPLAGQKNKPKQTQSKPVLSAACPEHGRMGRMGQSAFLPLLQDLYILYPLQSTKKTVMESTGLKT